MRNWGVSESQRERFRMRQASLRPSYRCHSTILRKIKSVSDHPRFKTNCHTPDFREIVTVGTVWQTVFQIAGRISTGSVSGYPGIGAFRTISLAEASCKDGKVRWEMAKRLYRDFDVIAKRTPRCAQCDVCDLHDSPRNKGSDREILQRSYRCTSGRGGLQGQTS